MDEVIGRIPMLVDGVSVTLALGISSLILSIIVGLLGAWAKLSSSKSANRFANGYTTIVRGVPDLVWMLLVYFGGQHLINQFTDAFGLGYIEVSAFSTGVFCLGLFFGAYMTETFRGAFLAIPKGQIEAAVACGMSRILIFRRITWPLMMRYALPGLTNNWLVLVKSTALVSIIGLQDVVYLANAAGKSTRQPFTFILVVMLIFLLITALSNFFLKKVERKYSVGLSRG